MILEKTKPAQGSWTTSKVYTLGGGDIGFIIAERDYSGGTPTNKWYHYDRLGNVMAQTTVTTDNRPPISTRTPSATSSMLCFM